MYKKVLLPTFKSICGSALVSCLAAAAITNPALAQKPTLGSPLTLPETYMVLSSHVVNGEYIVSRSIAESSDNVNPSGKNAGGFAVFKDKREYKDKLVQGFIDVFDVNSMQLKRSFPVQIPAKYGVKFLKGTYLSDKGAVLLLNSEENKDANGKGFNVTLRSISYDGVVSEDSVLMERAVKSTIEKYSILFNGFDKTTGDFYRCSVIGPKHQADKNTKVAEIQKFNAFGKQASSPMALRINPSMAQMRINFVDGKPYLLMAASKVDSATILPIKDGANFRTDGIHIASKPFPSGEPSRVNGEVRYIMGFVFNEKKNLNVTAYKLDYKGDKLTTSTVINTEMDRKVPEVDNFLSEVKQNPFGLAILASTDTPEGPSFLVGTRWYYTEGSQSGVHVTSGFILEATSNSEAPKVIYHLYKNTLMTMATFGTQLNVNLDFRAHILPSTESFLDSRSTSISFGPGLERATEVGEIAQTFTIRKMGDKYQIMRIVDEDLIPKIAKFIGKKLYRSGRLTSAHLTINQAGELIPDECQVLAGPNTKLANVILPSRVIMADDNIIGFLQNSKSAQLIKF